jgi:hypothetical protein
VCLGAGIVIPWIIAVGILGVMLLWEWERQYRLELELQDARQGELLRLPSGAVVEVWDWPEAEQMRSRAAMN